MHKLGVPGCDTSARTDAMETSYDYSAAAQTWNSFRRLRRFLRTKAVRIQGLIHPRTPSVSGKGKLEPYAGSPPLRPLSRLLQRTLAAVRLGNLWTKFAIDWPPRAGDDLYMRHGCDNERITKPDADSV